MNNKIRCQSCGMPLDDEFFGTDKGGTETHEYCKFCYQDGEYLQPDLTMDLMIQMSVDNMTNELQIDEEKARTLAKEFIPNLKRWKKS